MNWLKLSFVVVVFSILIVPTAAVAVQYTVTDLGALSGDAASFGFGLNDKGEVVGCSSKTSYSCGRSCVKQGQAFLYSNYAMHDLGTLGGTNSYAYGINGSGTVVGKSDTSSGAVHSFLYGGGTMQDLGAPTGLNSIANAVNESGLTVGVNYDPNSGSCQGYRYVSGTMYQVGSSQGSEALAVNNNGQIVGRSYGSNGSYAFLSNGVTTVDLNSSINTSSGWTLYSGQAINDSGMIAGTGTRKSGGYGGYVYNGGSVTAIGAFAKQPYSIPYGINNSGQVVGTSSGHKTCDGTTPFLYYNGTTTDLNTLITANSDWILTEAGDINNSGQIVGTGWFGSTGNYKQHAYLLTPIADGAKVVPGISLPTTLTDVRIMQNAKGPHATTSVAVTRTGTVAADFSLSTTSSLSPSLTSGTTGAGANTAVPVTLTWTDVANTGARQGIVTLTNESDATDPFNHQSQVTGAVLANRHLNISSLGTSSVPVRAMPKISQTTTISTGGDLADDDNHATRVDTVKGTVVSADKSVNVAYNGTPLTTFNDINQNAVLNVTFSKKGRQQGTLDLAGLLKNGEANTVGATLQSASLAYDVNVLEQRSLKGSTKVIDVLKGAPSADLLITSKNKSLDAATMVYLGTTGKSELGDLDLNGRVLVGGVEASGNITPVTTSASYVSLAGAKLSSYGTVAGSGALSVTSAEAASVGDTKAYKAMNVKYKVNVGMANKYTKKPTSAIDFSQATVLSASMAADSTLAGLASKLAPKGTLQDPKNISVAATSLKSKLYGPVGSEAEILTSTAIPTASTVSMQWRVRTKGEAHDPKATLPDSTMPSGCSWLASDVVKIDGIGGTVAYALQMTFDNRINLALDGATNGLIANEFPSLYIAEYDTTKKVWENAAGASSVGHKESFAKFMTDHAGVSLSSLLGNWGVDTTASSNTGIGYAWTVVSGSGIFAVDPCHPDLGGGITAVPEPSCIVLAMTGIIAAFAYARHKRCFRHPIKER